MTRLAKLQLVGRWCVRRGAGCGRRRLCFAAFPSSELLWQSNLKLFVAFHRAHYILNEASACTTCSCSALQRSLLVGFISSPAAAPCHLEQCKLHLRRVRLLCSLQVPPEPRAASLAVVGVPSGADLCLLIVLLGASVVSFVVSHLIYVRAVRARAPCHIS
jgi:hypothetical protein